jgi:hypothetical protein
MQKFLVALFLLSVPVSVSALAHSGTDQDEKACAPDVQRFCRKLMDQGDFTILACLKENRVPLRAGHPRTMTIGFPFGAGALSCDDIR